MSNPASETSPMSAAETTTISNLSPPAAPALSTNYALQAAQFPSMQSANALSSQIQAQGVSSLVLAVTDQDGTQSWVVTAGQFNSADEARSQRNHLSLKLGLPSPLAVMIHPTATTRAPLQ